MIIRGQQQLMTRYAELTAGDVFVGHLPAGPIKQAILLYLSEAGVRCLPSALSQALNRSKAFQAWVYRDHMLPHTSVISRRADLIQAINRFNRHSVGPVVTKDDRRHCGHGICLWESTENLYNAVAATRQAPYPFVIQPYLEAFTDVRAIVAGDYTEAYTRTNPYNFRQNISAGGRSTPFTLTEALEAFCRLIMGKGRFPYAHIDLQLTPDGGCYLAEIALEGGIKGACIDRPALNAKKRQLLEAMARNDP